MTTPDALFLLLFAVIVPIYGLIQYRRLWKEEPEALAANRRSYYNSTIIFQWTMGLVLVALWIAKGRDWPALGFTSNIGDSFWIAMLIAAGTLGYFYFQLQKAKNGDAAVRNKIRRGFGDTDPILPHNRGDLQHFYGVSFTAGTIEEVVFRGYWIWLLSQFMPVWVAAAIGIIHFALVHSYQGARQLPALLTVSTALMIVFLLSGSLWLPMVLHIGIDVIQGHLAYEILSRDNFIEQTEADLA